MIPNILPIGPLLASTDHPRHGSFWLEDSTCLSWLDKQPACSVIYVAFGSTAIFSQHQFEELALGLELSGRPFLWVVRSNLTNAEYPDGFTVADDHGKIVEWAPQEKVLAHPSTACFLTHCGWNSTMEGLSMGVPFLCWPYFSDQFHNQSKITDMWKVGLRLNPDKNGIISRHEIKAKIENLLSDDGIKANALKLKEMAGMSVKEGGSSFKNFERFIEHLKH
uniref:Putative UDP-glycosyltransferase 83A1 n=1 Tax=Davidia involucrata TaxID=16924 RepID=A0A5B7C3P4_DAVIN